MASFLVRAFDLEGAPSVGFADTGGSTHEANIDALFAAGITVGCKQDPLRYCPDNPVSRAQMATLLSRGLDSRPEPGSFSIDEGTRSNDTLVSASRGRTCAVRLDGGLACWGWDGLRERFATAGLQNVVAVSTADNPQFGLHACVLHEDRSVSCWGSGADGKLGQGNTNNHYLPVAVPGLNDAVAVSAGGEHTCAVHSDGGVSCWGPNRYGELGDGTPRPSYSPRRVPGLSDVVAVAAGPYSNCAVHRDGAVSCWGWPYASTPSRFDGPDAMSSVSIGQDRTCATTVAGAVYCWPWGQTLADATRVGNLTDVVEVSVGDGAVCGLHRDGGVSCWGEDNAVGQVGDGTTTPRPQPVRLAGISDAVAVSVSLGSPALGAHACALHEDGSASCWGGNELGQVGDGTTDNRLVPTRVKRIERIPADQTPATSTDLLRTWADAVVQEREADYPWMRVAWYTENITNGAELWAAWLRCPSLPALANLAGEFGGLCSTDWITYPFDPERFPPADSSPCRDGGCRAR